VSSTVELFLILGVVYLMECVQLVPAGAVVFHRLLGARWRAGPALRPNPRWRRGGALGTPWPPLSPALVCEALPLVPGASGVALLGGEGRVLGWRELREVRAEGTALEVAGGRVLTVATRRMARTLAAALRDAAGAAPGPDIARLIDRLLDRRFDVDAAPRRLQALARGTRLLSVFQGLLWLTVFVGLPLFLWSPLVMLLSLLVLLALVSWIGAVVCFHRALRRLPDLPRELWPDRAHRVLVTLSPLSTMRARDLLAREAVGDLDPLAVAAALLPPDRAIERVRVALVEIDHLSRRPPGGGAAGLPAEESRAYYEKLAARVRGLARRLGADVAELLAPPPREDAHASAYCPRCRVQYRSGTVCQGAECGDMPLSAFP
jgi:hypothetical protein